MIDAKSQAVLIHYPSGGFGHFLHRLITTCTGSVFHCLDNEAGFSLDGNSHAMMLSVQTWRRHDPLYEFTVADWVDDSEKTHLLLVDSFISDDRFGPIRDKFPSNRVIRMCIDYPAIPIIHQTCETKANGKTAYDCYSGLEWEYREFITLRYHHADAHPNDFYLRNFKPVIDHNTLNIPISWLFYNFEKLLENLSEFLGVDFDANKTTQTHQNFLNTNLKYAMGPTWADIVLNSLKAGTNVDLSSCTNIYDQAYVNYRVEKEYNLKEIPAYTYRDWFIDTNEFRRMLGLLK